MANSNLLLLFLVLFLFLACCEVKCCDYTRIIKWNIQYTEDEYIMNTPFKMLNAINELNNIRNAYVIMINDNNISTLCSETIVNFPKLVLLELINSNIVHIEPGAFNNLSNGTILHLERNKLDAVHSGIFTGLEITSLYLDENQISFINSDAFDNMPNLEVLSINRNSISDWNTEWFRQTPRLTYLYFNENKIKTLPANALKNLSEYVTNSTTLLLDNNRITDINARAFKGLKIFGKIILSGNKLMTLSDELMAEFEKVLVLDLRRNKFSCLLEEVLLSLRNVSIIKLQNNPLDDRCRSKIQDTVKKEGINIYLNDAILL